MGEVCDWILSGLAPPLPCEEERPAEREDYQDHIANSLDILRQIQASDNISENTVPSIVLLCSQHCSCSWEQDSELLPWSSEEHQDISDQLISVIEARFLPLASLLTEADGRLFRSLLRQLQPSLVQFTRQPGSVRSLLWLTSQVVEPPSLDPLVPLLLPHLLHWLDSWLPPCKVSGCQLAHHLATHSSPAQLKFYGRAEVVAEPLSRLLAPSTDLAVLRAAVKPLLLLTELRDDQPCPATPGQADKLMAAVISSLELSSEQERREVFCQLATDILDLLGPGAARWVSPLANIVVSMLDSFLPPPPPSAFTLLSSLASQCPECVGRETSPLLTSLFRYLYRLSWAEEADSARLSAVRDCLTRVATCDPPTSRRLCHGLGSASVNNTFDNLTRDILININV